MKLTKAQWPDTLRKLSALEGALLFGAEHALVRSRAAAAVKAALGGDGSIFGETVLTKEEHRHLEDVALSPALGGSRPVVRVLDAGDALLPSVTALSKRGAPAFIVLEAGELTPRSKLRGFAERHDRWAALGCYPETPRAIRAEIEAVFARAGLAVTPDAATYLADELSTDSARRETELAKLVLYAHDTQMVTLDAATASCGQEVEATLGSAVTAALNGHVEECDRLCDELALAGATGQGLLAVLSGQMHRLLRLRAAVSAGASVRDAIAGLRPPVYASQVESLAGEVARWGERAIDDTLSAIRVADLACKRAGSRDYAIASRLLLSIAARQAR